MDTLEDFLGFYFPAIHEDIDFGSDIQFLDKELQKLLPAEDESGKHVVDKLVRVYLRTGEARSLLIHNEVQGYRANDFALRVYRCNYRIFDHYGDETISLALLTDEHPGVLDAVYEVCRWGFRQYFTFPVVKLLDYRERRRELEASKNPFAVVTRAFLRAVESRGEDRSRYGWKKAFFLELLGDRIFAPADCRFV